ncbi:MAG: hypothetical protein KJ578_15445 [Bacteroidetes bacterium]|nr:hypothetical protein [Bacteroidota bacterium]
MNSPLIFEQSVWLVILVVAMAAAIAALLYFKAKSTYPQWLKYLLFAMRFFSLVIIGLLLLKPYMMQQTTLKEPPVVAVVHDNSASITMSNDSALYGTGYLLKYDSLLNQLSKSFQTDTYLFGSVFSAGKNPDFADAQTDFSAMFDALNQIYYKRNLGAVILLSDGIYNAGFQPEMAASGFPFVVHSVVLGDTAVYPDLSVYDVRYNRKALVNTVFPVEVTVRAQQAFGENMKINLLIDGEPLETKTVAVSSNQFSATLNFLVEADSPGLKNLKINIAYVDGEVNATNNDQMFFVDVMEQQQKIVVLAHAPHPDLAAIKAALGNHYELEYRFGNDMPSENETDADLLILHQLPDGIASEQQIAALLAAQPALPVLWINGQSTAAERFNELQDVISIFSDQSAAVVDASPLLNPNFSAFTTDQFDATQIKDLPPLSVLFGDYQMNTSAEVLFEQQLRGVETKRPLIAFGNSGQRKIGVVAGTGIWRWRLFQFSKTASHQNFDALISKIIQYATLRYDNSLLKIFADEEYAAGSPVKISAEMRNKSGELIVEPQLAIRLFNEQQGLNYNYEFVRRKNDYQLNAGSLEEGIYTYEATASYAGELLKETGRFSVKRSVLEGRQLVAEVNRMRQLAALTGGKTYDLSALNMLLSDLQNDERLVTVSHQEKRFDPLINLEFILAILLVLLSVEWLLRKIFGDY